MNSSMFSSLYRCEMLVTNRCNFQCPYCRSIKGESDISLVEATKILRDWIFEGLKNVRFSGGEPTLYKNLLDLVHIARRNGVEHIAISTNGSAETELYKNLIEGGVNDFSVSLDACCAGTGSIMSGVDKSWKDVIKNIKFLSSKRYTTVGIVLNERNEQEAENIIMLAHDLGVADIRVIPSAQYNKFLSLDLPPNVINSHPILKYRITSKRHVRGLSREDSRKCKLVLDDMAVWDGEHYPCIIYLREGGRSIGQVNNSMRKSRYDWYLKHDSWKDIICRKNCLDVCRTFNNTAARGNSL